jgi:hypothetical protein
MIVLRTRHCSFFKIYSLLIYLYRYIYLYLFIVHNYLLIVVLFGNRELVNLHKPEGLKMIVSEDGALYLDKITETCTHHHGKEKKGEGSESQWHGSIIMVSPRSPHTLRALSSRSPSALLALSSRSLRALFALSSRSLRALFALSSHSLRTLFAFSSRSLRVLFAFSSRSLLALFALFAPFPCSIILSVLY